VVSVSQPAAVLAADPLHDVDRYHAEFVAWLTTNPDVLAEVAEPSTAQRDRIAAMRRLMARLFEAGWSRYGWPPHVGGLGGTIGHRATMWAALAQHGLTGMEMFEHLEVLAPTLVELGPAEFVAEALPAYLAGDQLWAQGFSEPDAGSDLAALRTVARPTADGYLISGRKIWTSWAPWARWCLVLARTGTAASRHRGVTAFIVDLHHPGVEVRALPQANGNAELAEVSFDEVPVSAERIVGDLDGGWAVAMHILSHERGTFAWFRHCLLYPLIGRSLGELAERGEDGQIGGHDRALGDALLDLASVNAAAHAALESHAAGTPLGPRATVTKLLLCAAERSVNDWMLATRPELAFAAGDPATLHRQEYLFSRIVTVYGGSQQMQLETIAKQILELP
jgi:alkylation response protein AidB-like acyl-CoA dehydrogenase